jgi:hypothetical protein
MKKQIIIPLLTLMIIVFGNGYAQKATNQPEPDPKLSLKEQLAILKAGQDNPDRPVMIADPKGDGLPDGTSKEEGPTNYKAEPIVEREEVPPPQIILPSPSGEVITQPEGGSAESVTNYRQISGSPDQPQVDSPENVINYRNLNGDKEQPVGDPPK